jgi:hypothetical protein
LRILIGLTFWTVLSIGLWAAAQGAWATSALTQAHCMADIQDYYLPAQRLRMRLPESCALAVGDPVFAVDAGESFQQVGVIVARKDRDAQAVLFPSAPRLASPIQAGYVNTPDSLAWVVQTLLPPQRRKEIEDELTAAIKEHHREILRALQPVVSKSVREALAVLEQDLPVVLAKHRQEFEAIAGKDREEILKRELLPLAKAEIWPIVRRDSEPLVRQVSSELWERVSLWSLAWRGAADKLPLLRGKNRVEAALLRFVDQEAVPILEQHEEDFLALVEAVVRDAAENEKVRSALRRSAARAAEDPELQRVVHDVLYELVVENPRFWSTVKTNWTSPEALEALHLTAKRLEPTVRRIGEIVLGSRDGALTPEFTRVLRRQVLLKDRQGIVVGDKALSDTGIGITPVEAWFSGPQP